MILVTGSLAFDFIMNFSGRFSDQIIPDKIHILNLSFLTDRLRKNFGGTAANVAYSLALLGKKTTILATAGKDFATYKKFLKKNRVETKYIKIYKNSYTSNYFAVVDKSDNQLGGFYSGPMDKASRLSIKGVKDGIRFAVIGPSAPAAIYKFSKECQELKIPFLFDPGMQIPRLGKKQLLASLFGAEILIANDYEVALIFQKTGLTKTSLLKKVKILITTLAEKGSIIDIQNKTYKIKAAKPKNTSDPTGAGDAYRAGFLAGYLRGFDLKTCGQMGSVCAVYTVEKYGTTTHRFSKKQFIKRYKENYGEEIKL